MSAAHSLIFASLLLGGTAEAATWSVDASHTRVGFRVTHMLISSVEGQFPGVTGTLEFEPGQLDDLSVTVEVDMTTVDTRNEKRDGHLKGPDFLHVEAHPTMTFASTDVKARRDGSFDLIGDLTIRGVTKQVTLQGTGLTQSIVDPWGNERVGARAVATIDRQDFGVSWNQSLDAGGMVVGDELELQIDVEFVRSSS